MRRVIGAALALLAAACASTEAPREIRAVFQCGDVRAAVTFMGESATLVTGSARYDMRQTRTADGARYEAVGDPSTWFWNRGQGGTLSVGGREYPDCRTVAGSAQERRAVRAGAGKDA
jgi:membrane-bound inhibitor of C-type lysozyme